MSSEKERPDRNKAFLSFRLGGYPILFTLGGALVGRCFFAMTMLRNDLTRAEFAAQFGNIVPWVVTGALIGLFYGWIAEHVLPKWKSRYWISGVLALILLAMISIDLFP